MAEQSIDSYNSKQSQYAEMFSSVPGYIFILALGIRLALIPASIWRVNPYATADAVGFANAASLIAQQFLAGQSPFDLQGYSSSYETWGLFLSPFWLLPGPSEIYAHIFVAFIGSVAVYNVAVIAQYYHSPRAGVFAALPLATYPTIVMTHSALLREAAVLFGITTAVRYLLIVSPQWENQRRIFIIILSLGLVTALRPENAALYIGSICLGLFLWLLALRPSLKKPTVLISIPVGILFIHRYFLSAINHIRSIRDYRARGRSAYLTDIPVETFSDLIALSGLGAVYFLYSPFIWMVELPRDLVGMTESSISLIFTIAAIAGLPIAFQRHPIKTTILCIAFLVGVIFYGFGTANVGTAVRHRPMFLWVIFIIGGIGLADNFRLVRSA